MNIPVQIKVRFCKRMLDMCTVEHGINRYVLQFAKKVSRTIEDMTGIEFKVKENTIEEKAISFEKGMVVFLPFAGTVQGTCILILDEKVALRLIGVNSNLSKQEISDFRPDTADAIKEIMNIAIGQLLVQLETDFGDLSYSNAIVTFGNTYFPKVASGSIFIEGEPGSIKCVVSLNMVNLKIAKKLKSITEDLTVKSKQLYIDGLTSLYNRLYFDEIYSKKLDSYKESKHDISVLFIDIDFFKSFNDNYGHQVGDLVLIAVSKIIKDTIRTEDIPCRYGGDEIILILPETNLEEAKQAAERIKKAITKFKLNKYIKADSDLNITLSMGIAQFQKNDSPEILLSRVDAALYKAKTRGRNQIVISLP